MNKNNNVIEVSTKNCKRCGYCIEYCPRQVFQPAKDGFPLVVNSENCSGCGLCNLRCPDFAIELEVKQNDQA